MFILELNQEGMGTEVGLFRTIEEGRAFISQVKGYKYEEEEGFVYESLELRKIPEYMELHYNGHIVPLTKFMFTEEGDIDIFWNRDVKDYIEKRESQYRKVKAFLEAKGYEADRAYFGSEDGEAVLYRKKGSKDWHFLSHMDPDFIEEEDFPGLLD